MRKVGGILAVLMLMAAGGTLPTTGQDAAGLDVGLSFGLLIFPEVGSMSTVGGSFGFAVSDTVAFRIAYWRAGLSILGISIFSINVFDAAILIDLLPGSPVGIYVFGGGAYLFADLFGEGGGGAAFTAGLGLRATPTESLRVYVEYRPVIKYEVLHVVQVGASILF